MIWIYTIDTPKPIYFCPLNRNSIHLWADENCYWSSSYAEAREKFIALGNVLREQLETSSNNIELVEVKSISYDVSDDILEKYGIYSEYLDALEEVGGVQQTISPSKDTIDTLLLTLRIPKDETKELIDVIHSSGVHGVEGYLGSAIQIRFLHEMILRNKELIARNKHNLSDEYKLRKILLIHSVNPYGMRHNRRTNENNVDINRNALSTEEWGIIRSRDPNFAGYVSLDSILNPFVPVNGAGELFSWVDAAKKSGYTGDVSELKQRDNEVQEAASRDQSGSMKQCGISPLGEASNFDNWLKQNVEIIKSIPRLIKALAVVGYTQTKRAFVSSQYLKQVGSQYGGGAHKNHKNVWENSVFAVEHAIKQFMSSANNLFWIDVHTGLGKYGKFALLSAGTKYANASKNDPPDWVRKLTQRITKSQNTDKSSDKGVSEGYNLTRGFINSQLICRPPNCFANTQEFGTRPGILVGMAMVLENKGHSIGTNNFAFATSWAFNPKRLSWRRKTMTGGIEMLYTALDV